MQAQYCEQAVLVRMILMPDGVYCKHANAGSSTGEVKSAVRVCPSLFGSVHRELGEYEAIRLTGCISRLSE